MSKPPRSSHVARRMARQAPDSVVGCSSGSSEARGSSRCPAQTRPSTWMGFPAEFTSSGESASRITAPTRSAPSSSAATSDSSAPGSSSASELSMQMTSPVELATPMSTPPAKPRFSEGVTMRRRSFEGRLRTESLVQPLSTTTTSAFVAASALDTAAPSHSSAPYARITTLTLVTRELLPGRGTPMPSRWTAAAPPPYRSFPGSPGQSDVSDPLLPVPAARATGVLPRPGPSRYADPVRQPKDNKRAVARRPAHPPPAHRAAGLERGGCHRWLSRRDHGRSS